ncbi:MAG: ABC transporter ATP-binding protein [Desulfofustis sp.]|nr:ABC transporter ATP-binding protein [Desulfofustis sp.]MBT8344928.1 ABC transporter ATP-binding protein [Desulfofustis sp.]NNK56822.1 ABC transporter ATP-binding protein [Desulfofustis sp.]RZW26038.1 MAG: ABC transporter ATP-binding protein [Desulfobulbaceae bacterium]
MAIIRVDSVSKVYHQGRVSFKALDNVALSIEKGEFVALAGPSGSGKTTLLNLIGGLDTPDEGEVYFDHKNLSEMNDSQRADLRLHHIGFVFQAYNLIPVLTAAENIDYILLLQKVEKSVRSLKVNAILQEVGLAEKATNRPDELSGGQQQRVAVARAIITDPQVVLADEPTANLDSKTGRKLLEMMKQMNRSKQVTFIFATHDPMVMEFADRLVSLQDGRIVSDTRK